MEVVYLVHFVAMVTGDTSGLRQDPSAWVRFRQLPASLRLGASGCVDASRRIEADHLYLYLGLFHGWLLRPSHFTLQHVGTYTIKRLSVKKKHTHTIETHT